VVATLVLVAMLTLVSCAASRHAAPTPPQTSVSRPGHSPVEAKA
jgi:hypothetical protein